MKLRWTYKIKEEIENEESFYIVSVDEFPGVCSDGETVEEAMTSIKEALYAAIELSLELGKEIPTPIDQTKFKGNVAYRTTPRRHSKLAQEAQIRRLSLSKMLDTVVDSYIQ